MAIDIAQGYRTERYECKHLPGGGLCLYPDAQYLVIRLPDSRGLKLIARLFLLGLVIVSLPWIGSILERSLTSQQAVSELPEVGSDLIINLQLLPLLFRDLTNEGFLKVGEKAVFLSNGNEEAIYRSLNLSDYKMDLIPVKDLERQSSVQIQTLDFTLASNFPASAEFIDRTLKIGGIVIVELSENPSVAFHKPFNYKIVYLRRFESTNIIAMKKTGIAELNSATQRRLCGGYASEAKKAALKNLEDVLLEPPRSASRKSNRYLKRTRYLPDLMGDSLESYPRHVFIDVGLPEKEGGSGTSWFGTNYPTRNKDFDVYKIETVTEESSGKEVTQIGMSDWLMTNVKEEEYVVMKAEAEVVEEMVKMKTIRLVDELFLECKPKGHGGNGNNRSGRRAYWECLALYGRLRDEGIAVHQWWG